MAPGNGPELSFIIWMKLGRSPGRHGYDSFLSAFGDGGCYRLNHPMKEDAELLRAYADGKSEEAFAELLRRHLDLVYSAALRQVGGDAHLARDVAQTVFVDLARKASQLAGRPALAGWLYTSAHFAAAKVVRTEQRRRVREQEAQTMQNLLADDHGAARDWDRLRPVLDAAMLELNEADREAVVLRFFSGRSFPEVGVALRLNEEAARKRVDRALDKLHGLLSRRGVTSTSVALGLALTQNAVAAAPAEMGGSICGVVVRESLAGSAGVAGTAGSLFFMSNLKTGLFVGLTLALASLLLVQQFNLRAAGTEQAALETQAARLRVAVFGKNRDLVATDAEIARLATAIAAEPEPVTQPPVLLPPDRDLDVRVKLDDTYAPLYRHLKLNETELAQLRDLLVEREASSVDVRRLVGVEFDNWSFAMQQELLGVGAEMADAKIRRLLGSEQYAYFARYAYTLPWRSIIANTRLEASGTSVGIRSPFSDEQIDALTNWAAEETPDRYGYFGFGGPAIADTVVAKAVAILDPSQLEKLRKLQAANAAKDEVRRIRSLAEKDWRARLGLIP